MQEKKKQFYDCFDSVGTVSFFVSVLFYKNSIIALKTLFALFLLYCIGDQPGKGHLHPIWRTSAVLKMQRSSHKLVLKPVPSSSLLILFFRLGQASEAEC